MPAAHMANRTRTWALCIGTVCVGAALVYGCGSDGSSGDPADGGDVDEAGSGLVDGSLPLEDGSFIDAILDGSRADSGVCEPQGETCTGSAECCSANCTSGTCGEPQPGGGGGRASSRRGVRRGPSRPTRADGMCSNMQCLDNRCTGLKIA